MHRILVLLVLAILAACAAQQPRPIGAELHQQCGETRPEVCTMQFAPVCAFIGKKQRKEFSNACAACTDPSVTGYITGPCPN